MCAININEFDGNVGTNTQHDTNTNPDAILFGSIKETTDKKATRPMLATGQLETNNGLDSLGFWENEDIYIPPNTQINSGKLLGQIMDLSNEYIIYAMQHQLSREENNDAKHIMIAPPWEQSNELFDTLSQYTGIQASSEKTSALKQFFYSIMYGNAQDPNGDGVQNVNDVFEIWGGNGQESNPLTKIQDLSKKLLEDPYNHLIQVPELGKALAQHTGTEYDLGKADRLISFFLREKSDLTGDGQIDHQDVIKFWKDLEPPTKGDINEDGNIDKSDVKELRLALLTGDINRDGKLDQEDYKLLQEMLNHIPVPLDGENLQGAIHRQPPLRPGDLNRDGKIDQQDLDKLGKILKSGDMDDDGKVDRKDLELLVQEVKGGNTQLPPRVRIDLGNDKKADFFINGGKMFQVFDDYIKEVDHLEGIDIKELAKEIKKHNGYAGPSQFEVDINHDGKMDSIFTDNMPIVMGNEQQANHNPENTKPFINSGEGHYDFAQTANQR